MSQSYMMKMAIMERVGYQYTYMSMEEVWSFLEQAQPPKNCQLMSVQLTMDRKSYPWIYQEAVQSLQNYTKQSKNSKMVLCSIIATPGNVAIYAVLKSQSSPTPNWTQQDYQKTDGISLTTMVQN